MNSPYNGKFRVTQQYKGSTHDGLDLVGVDSKEVHSTVNGVVEKQVGRMYSTTSKDLVFMFVLKKIIVLTDIILDIFRRFLLKKDRQ